MKCCKTAREHKYQGVRPPHCDGGKGCDTCREIFQDVCLHPVDFLQLEEGVQFTLVCTRCRADVTEHLSNFFTMQKLLELDRRVKTLEDELGAREPNYFGD